MKFLVTFLLLFTACGSRAVVGQGVESRNFTVVDTYPHDPAAYTQGLFWHDGALWESTGEYGHSTMRRVDLESGDVVHRTHLGDDFFGEGAAVLGGKIYQLTWLEQTAFVWDENLTLLEKMPYRGQGWGLTTDGTNLYMSDGTANICVLDPADLSTRRTIIVRREGRPLDMINELEWIDGEIWANIYLSDTVVIIDPATGNVEATVDFSGLRSLITTTPQTDVLNGIAHDPATGRTWLTGKNWNKLFEVEVER